MKVFDIGLFGQTPTIDLAVGYRKANTSPILTLFLSRIDEVDRDRPPRRDDASADYGGGPAPLAPNGSGTSPVWSGPPKLTGSAFGLIATKKSCDGGY